MKYDFLIDKADVSAFNNDGVVCLRNVLNGEQVQNLAGALDYLAGEIPGSKAGYDVTRLRRQIWDGDAGTGDSVARQHDVDAFSAAIRETGAPALVDRDGQDRGHFLLDTSTWRRSTAVRELALDSVLPGVAAQLMRTGKVNYCDDQIFIKPPQTMDRTAFHQDYTYFRMRGMMGCVMWVCVDHADERSGGIAYVKGSHRWQTEFLPNVFMAQVSMPGGRGESLEDIENNPQNYDIVRFETNPGDIIIHHFMTVHGGGGNHTQNPRRALSLRYAAEDMFYYPRPGAPEQPYHSHQLAEGDPLDSHDFPVVWPRPFPGFSLSKVYDQ